MNSMPEKGGGTEAQGSTTGVSTGMCVLFVLIAIVLSVGLVWFVVVRPLKTKVAQLEGDLDTAVNLKAGSEEDTAAKENPKGVLENAGLQTRVMVNQNGKGLVTPGANHTLNKSSLTLYNQQ